MTMILLLIIVLSMFYFMYYYEITKFLEETLTTKLKKISKDSIYNRLFKITY